MNGAHLQILYLAVHDQNYPRNARIRDYLHDSGHRIEVVPLPAQGSYLQRCHVLLRSGRKATHPDVVILSELAIQYFWIGWVLAKLASASFVLDWFVGLYETNVEDWGRFSGRSWKGRLNAGFDRWSARTADLVVTDTQCRARAIKNMAQLN